MSGEVVKNRLLYIILADTVASAEQRKSVHDIAPFLCKLTELHVLFTIYKI